MREHIRNVWHRNQSVFETWKRDASLGWVFVPAAISENIPIKDMDFHELLHSMELDKDGHYGPYVYEKRCG